MIIFTRVSYLFTKIWLSFLILFPQWFIDCTRSKPQKADNDTIVAILLHKMEKNN